MKKIVTILFLMCAISVWAQQPLVKTHWTQEQPYNQHCPEDPLENNNHSYAGCPAVVMGQILNHLQTTQGTRFDDGDDYYTGNYFGRQFQIDDDWAIYGFPSFAQLNVLLDSADACFQRDEALPDSLASALVFACGVACKQVYSASDSYGSGTFSVDQAYAAYRRFGFGNCRLLSELDSAARAALISNLRAGYPVHLAVENQAGTSGHNVVVDAYRESNGKFHINFGWGGYKDGWYEIPDAGGFSYGWTKIEGIILDIIPDGGQMAIDAPTSEQPLEVFPNPVADVLCLKDLPCGTVDYSIIDVMGRMVASGSTKGTIPVSQLEKGLYLLQTGDGEHLRTARFVVR